MHSSLNSMDAAPPHGGGGGDAQEKDDRPAEGLWDWRRLRETGAEEVCADHDGFKEGRLIPKPPFFSFFAAFLEKETEHSWNILRNRQLKLNKFNRKWALNVLNSLFQQNNVLLIPQRQNAHLETQDSLQPLVYFASSSFCPLPCLACFHILSVFLLFRRSYYHPHRLHILPLYHHNNCCLH